VLGKGQKEKALWLTDELSDHRGARFVHRPLSMGLVLQNFKATIGCLRGVLLCIAVSGLAGCPFVPWDRMWWPVARNDFSEAIDIHIDYSNGSSRDWHTERGRCVVTGIPHGRLTELTVWVRGAVAFGRVNATVFDLDGIRSCEFSTGRSVCPYFVVF
jgi:hypothetical protein